MIDRIFDRCVALLEWAAQRCGTTYKRLNVYLFCVAVPLLILAQTAVIVWLLWR